MANEDVLYFQLQAASPRPSLGNVDECRTSPWSDQLLPSRLISSLNAVIMIGAERQPAAAIFDLWISEGTSATLQNFPRLHQRSCP